MGVMPEEAPEPYRHTPVPWSPVALHREIYSVDAEMDVHTARAGMDLQRLTLGSVATGVSAGLLAMTELLETMAEADGQQDPVFNLTLDITEGLGRFITIAAASFTIAAYLGARWHIGRKYDVRDAAIERELRQRDA